MQACVDRNSAEYELRPPNIHPQLLWNKEWRDFFFNYGRAKNSVQQAKWQWQIWHKGPLYMAANHFTRLPALVVQRTIAHKRDGPLRTSAMDRNVIAAALLLVCTKPPQDS